MNEQKQAYPLYWPDGWPRTPFVERRRSAFGGGHPISMDKAVTGLAHELELLKAEDSLLSTNMRRRLDGFPMSGLAQPSDAGAAAFFKLAGKDVALPCDRWNRVECNVYAIAKHIEALRGQKRWGVGNIEQAFRGYMALPSIGQSSGANPWQVLGVSINASEEQLTEAYRVLAKKFHPDNPETGDRERFERVKNAYDMLAQNLRKKAA